jgi:hypothetical protein
MERQMGVLELQAPYLEQLLHTLAVVEALLVGSLQVLV